MKKLFIVSLGLFLSGCFPTLEEVRVMEAACKKQGGEVRRNMTGRDGKTINYIQCVVDGAIYQVSKDGKLK